MLADNKLIINLLTLGYLDIRMYIEKLFGKLFGAVYIVICINLFKSIK